MLTCRVKHPPGAYRATTLLHWTGPVNESITIGEQYSYTDYIERKLEFDYLTSSHDGRYECQITTTFAHFHDSVLEKKDFFLKVKSKLMKDNIDLALSNLILRLSCSLWCF